MATRWTRPTRRLVFGSVFWLAWVALMLMLWSVSRVSWISYSEVPYFNQMGLPNTAGRKTTVLGIMSYLTIDRDMVDFRGQPIAGGAAQVQWNWDRSAIAWSAAISVGSAIATFFVIRFLVAAYRLKGLCDECGYDLTALESGRCPECGTQLARRVGPAGGAT